MYRCSKCRARKSLRMKPEHYVRLPRCAGCRRKMTAHPMRSTEPHYVFDRYRFEKERGKHPVCRCDAYVGRCGNPMPHRRGSGWCIHNPRKSDADREQRDIERFRLDTAAATDAGSGHNVDDVPF